MNQVQKGGGPPMVESYIDGTKVIIRPFLDQRFWREDWHKCLTRFFQPGMHHYFCAKPGIGKTSAMVSLMQTLLHKELTPGRNWKFLTNQFFYYLDEEGNTKTSYPKGVVHYNTIKELLSKIKTLKGDGFDVAVVIDDLEKFYTDHDTRKGKKKRDELSECIRFLARYRKKLGIMLWTASSENYSVFENDSEKRSYSDIMWNTSLDEISQVSQNAKIRFPARDYWYALPADNGNVLIPRTSWAYEHSEKTKGFFFDREGGSILKMGADFDAITMFESFAQTPTTEIWNTVSKYLDTSATPSSPTNTDDYTEIALKLKNMGLTDEAIEWALSVPKTTLRRHVEKYGKIWAISDEQPYLFKKIKNSERKNYLTECKNEEGKT